MSDYSADFERFWQAYPRRIAKREAWKAWTQTEGRRPATDDLLMALGRVILSEWHDRESRLIPHASTWLRRDGWLEAPAPPKPIATGPYPPGMARPIYCAMVEAKKLGHDPASLRDARDPDHLDTLFEALCGRRFYRTYFPHLSPPPDPRPEPRR